ncbi:MAG TPA: MEDS domain-containing protein [Mycobacteriales bacterium]|jgi:hypothetical protein|nr:MEDS domain-containing protein [Mycobacteriales bacterium]
MTAPVGLGIPGLSAALGSHMCVFYRGSPERDQILVPFLREGLRVGDKCVCVVDTIDPGIVLTALALPEIQIAMDNGQLEVHSSLDTYFRTGVFSADGMLAYWLDLLATAVQAGYPRVRVIAEESWSLRQLPGVEELIVYEAKFDRHATSYPLLCLCMYDMDRFGGDLLFSTLETHPKVLVGGLIHENPYYIPPEEFLAGRV